MAELLNTPSPTDPLGILVSPRFDANVQKGDGCWEWSGSLMNSGYGRFNLKKRWQSAHRMAYSATHGPIPEGLLVCHKCDNPRCVRPSHLFLGTCKDNVHDCIRKGRCSSGDSHWLRRTPGVMAGEANPHAMLTESQVIAMLTCLSDGMTRQEVADKFKVRKEIVSRIDRGKSWSHVTTKFRAKDGE